MDSKVKEYIEKQPSPQKEICMKLREIILHTLPNIVEEFKWGAPVYGNGQFYIGSFKKNVNLGFSIEGLSDEEMKLFEGSGKTMKHVKIRTFEEIDDKKIVNLLKLVAQRRN